MRDREGQAGQSRIAQDEIPDRPSVPVQPRYRDVREEAASFRFKADDPERLFGLALQSGQGVRRLYSDPYLGWTVSHLVRKIPRLWAQHRTSVWKCGQGHWRYLQRAGDRLRR